MTARPEGWEGRLAVYLAESGARPFRWGVQDCARFACAGLAAQGVGDPMKGVAPYSTARGALGAMRRLGGDMDAAATALAGKAGLREIAPAFAGRGCVVLADIETPPGPVEPALGLVDMGGVMAVFAGTDGPVWLPLRKCRRAWGFD